MDSEDFIKNEGLEPEYFIRFELRKDLDNLNLILIFKKFKVLTFLTSFEHFL